MEKTLKLLCEMRAKTIRAPFLYDELDACIAECEGAVTLAKAYQDMVRVNATRVDPEEAVKTEKRFKALHDIYVDVIEAECHPWSDYSEAELVAEIEGKVAG